MASLVDDSGTTRFEGTITGASAAPGTLGRGIYGGADRTTIPNNGSDKLIWLLDAGDALLDVSAPTDPVVITSGIYAVSVYVEPIDPMTADGYHELTLGLDTSDEDAEQDNQSRLATAARPNPICHAALTYYVPAGGTLFVKTRNRDGAQTLQFAISIAVVQRVA